MNLNGVLGYRPSKRGMRWGLLSQRFIESMLPEKRGESIRGDREGAVQGCGLLWSPASA